MDSVLATVLGLSLRVVCDSTASLKLGSTIVGLWEGVVLHHFLTKRPSSTDPYYAYGLRLFLDYAIWQDLYRYLIIVFWTALGYVAADVLPDFWYATVGRSASRRLLRRLRYLQSLLFRSPRVRFYEEPPAPAASSSLESAVESVYVPSWRRDARSLPGAFPGGRSSAYTASESEDDLYERRQSFGDLPTIPPETEDDSSLSPLTQTEFAEGAHNGGESEEHVQSAEETGVQEPTVGISPTRESNHEWELVQVEQNPDGQPTAHQTDEPVVRQPPEEDMEEILDVDADADAHPDYESEPTVAESVISEGPHDEVLSKAAELRHQAVKEKKESTRLWKEYQTLRDEGNIREAFLRRMEASELDRKVQQLHRKAESRYIHVRRRTLSDAETNVHGLVLEEARRRIDEALLDTLKRGQSSLRVRIGPETAGRIPRLRHPLMTWLEKEKMTVVVDQESPGILIITI